MTNKVAEQLQSAISTAPFLIEKERYQLAVDEINRLQSIVDSNVILEDDSASENCIVYSGQVWHADECDSMVRFMRGHFQVFKSPKNGTNYEEYWLRCYYF